MADTFVTRKSSGQKSLIAPSFLFVSNTTSSFTLKIKNNNDEQVTCIYEINNTQPIQNSIVIQANSETSDIVFSSLTMGTIYLVFAKFVVDALESNIIYFPTLTNTQSSIGLNSSTPGTGPVQLAANGISTNGLYWLNIGDGRGVAQYYCVFDYPNGPYVMVAQYMSSRTGNSATFGIQNTGTASNGNIGSSTHFNSNIASTGTNIQASAYMVTNSSGAIFYTNLNTSSRNAIYSELRDTAGETSAGTNANTSFTSPGGAIFSNKTNQLSSWGSTGSIIELHHGGWSGGSGINYIIEIGQTSRSAGSGGYSNLRGFQGQGNGIFNFGSMYSGTIDYHFIKL